MSPTRFHHAVLTCALLLGASVAASAADEPVTQVSDKERLRHENTGIASGIVTGGLLAGPFGAIAGAAFGAWVGVHGLVADPGTESGAEERDMLAAALEEEHQSMLALQAQYRALEARHQVALREAEQAEKRNASLAEQARTGAPRVFACCNDSELDLHFKTNSMAIEPHYQNKLAALAKLARELPNAVVEISGHADRRGEADENLALSRQRVRIVADKLRSLGVGPATLRTNAYGESRPLTDSDTLENNFFDRRVIVKVTYSGTSLTSRNND